MSMMIYATAAVLLSQGAPQPGVWRSQGYGYVIDLGQHGARVYDYAKNHCVLTDEIDNIAALGRIEVTGPRNFVLVGDTARIGFERIAALPKVCRLPPEATQDPLVNFDVLWEIFAEQYPFFSVRQWTGPP